MLIYQHLIINLLDDSLRYNCAICKHVPFVLCDAKVIPWYLFLSIIVLPGASGNISANGIPVRKTPSYTVKGSLSPDERVSLSI